MMEIATAILAILAVTPSLAKPAGPPFSSRNRRVIGGSLASPGEFPFHVSLWYMVENIFTENTNMHHVCGGTLIDPEWVLTVAQCFEAQFIPGLEVLESWKVVVGKHNQLLDEDTDQVRSIAEIHRYENWDLGTMLGGAALLKLNQSIDMTAEGVGTLDPDDKSDCATPEEQCYVVGWGQVAEDPYGYGMYIPVVADVPLVSTETCQQAFDPANTDNITYSIDDSVLCAGPAEGGVDACFGDAGSPLVCRCHNKDVVSGIVSTGHGCAREGLYGIYTRVSPLKDWIKDVLKG